MCIVFKKKALDNLSLSFFQAHTNDLAMASTVASGHSSHVYSAVI